MTDIWVTLPIKFPNLNRWVCSIFPVNPHILLIEVKNSAQITLDLQSEAKDQVQIIDNSVSDELFI